MTAKGVQGGVVNMWLSRGSLEICPGCWPVPQIKYTLVQGRCNQIYACPGCTLKPVPGGVEETDACPQDQGDFT